MLSELDSKRISQAPMSTALASAHYLGAMSEDGERLTLVTIDPDDPWQAFRAMRRRLRRSNQIVDLALYDSPHPVEHNAEIVVLHPRRAV